ncbi:MAG: hypothetical protein JRJ20_08115 [Deltaproteobacteria bacterium]|nr:hypothetical protein [Deltaproteobacteria bacterium]
MKKSLMVLVLTISTLLLITGSAIALPFVLKPIPMAEPVIMLLFGNSLIVMCAVGRKLQRELKTIRD